MDKTRLNREDSHRVAPLNLTPYPMNLRCCVSLLALALAGCATNPNAPAPLTPVESTPPVAVPIANPRGIAVDNAGDLFIADTTNATVIKVARDGPQTVWGGDNSTVHFSGTCAVAVDQAGNVFVADTDNNRVAKITPAGEISIVAGSADASGDTDGPGATARFNDPTGIAVDTAGNLYVSDDSNGVVRKIAPDGTVSTLAGQSGQHGDTDGTGTSARFNGPRGIAVDGAGNVYVADENSSDIRKITPAGVVTTVAGVSGKTGSADGPGATATFNAPRALAVDASGTIYVADTDSATIRKIAPDGTVSTLAGQAGQTGTQNGTGAAALFNGPRGITTDAAGNIYVADSENNLIRKITPDGNVTTFAVPMGQ